MIVDYHPQILNDKFIDFLAFALLVYFRYNERYNINNEMIEDDYAK